MDPNGKLFDAKGYGRRQKKVNDRGEDEVRPTLGWKRPG